MVSRPNPGTVQLVQAYAAANARVRARVRQFLLSTWDGLGDYRDADIARMVKAAVPMVLGAQQQVSALTDAYLAGMATNVLGSPTRVAGVRPTDVTGAATRGVDPDEVYRRPGVTVWTALSNGKSLTAAVSAGRERLWDIAATDLQLAKTHTSRAVIQRDGRVAGYRRVLGGGNNCGLCVVASTQRYHVEDLMPIHPGCSCDVEPIYGDRDPGQVIDPDTLDQVHSAISERFGTFDPTGRNEVPGASLVDGARRGSGGREIPDFRDVMIVREHGEIGPMLTVKGHAFTGPSDI